MAVFDFSFMNYSAGIIGLGNVGALYDMPPYQMLGNSHAGAVTMSPSLQLVGGADIDKNCRKRFNVFWKVPTFPKYETMLETLNPDVVCIALPPSQQAFACIAALRTRAKAIICEKPFIMDVKTAMNIIKQCEAQYTILAVNHWMRWSTRWESSQKFLNSGQLGNIQTVRYIYSKGLYNSGTHAIDILRYLFGEVKEVRAYSSISLDTGENNIDGSLIFEKGNMIDLRTLDYRYHFTTECDIIGSEGRIILNDGLSYWKGNVLLEADRSKMCLRRAAFPLPVDDKQPPILKMISEIVHCIETGSPPVRCSGYDGIKACIVAKDLEKSYMMKSKKFEIGETGYELNRECSK